MAQSHSCFYLHSIFPLVFTVLWLKPTNLTRALLQSTEKSPGPEGVAYPPPPMQS